MIKKNKTKLKKQSITAMLLATLMTIGFCATAAISISFVSNNAQATNQLPGHIGGMVISDQPSVINTSANPGYRFVSWTSNIPAAVSISSPTSQNTSLKVIDESQGNPVITANFWPLDRPNVSVVSSNLTMGTVTGPSTATVFEETVVPISATPKAGYKFTGWTSSVAGVQFGDSTSATTSFVMPNSNVTITANFAVFSPVQMQIVTAIASNSSYGRVSVSNNNPVTGSSITINAIPYSGYRFVSWSSNNGGSFANYRNANTTFTVPNNNTQLTALFEEQLINYTPRPTYRPSYPNYPNYPSRTQTPTPTPKIVYVYPSNNSNQIVAGSSSGKKITSTSRNYASVIVNNKNISVNAGISGNMLVITPSKSASTENITVKLNGNEITQKVARVKLGSVVLDVPRANFKSGDFRIDVEKLASGSVYNAYINTQAKSRLAGPWDVSLEKSTGDASDVTLKLKIPQSAVAKNIVVQKYNRSTKKFALVKTVDWSVVQSGDDLFVKIEDVDSGVLAVFTK